MALTQEVELDFIRAFRFERDADAIMFLLEEYMPRIQALVDLYVDDREQTAAAMSLAFEVLTAKIMSYNLESQPPESQRLWDTIYPDLGQQLWVLGGSKKGVDISKDRYSAGLRAGSTVRRAMNRLDLFDNYRMARCVLDHNRGDKRARKWFLLHALHKIGGVEFAELYTLLQNDLGDVVTDKASRATKLYFWEDLYEELGSPKEIPADWASVRKILLNPPPKKTEDALRKWKDALSQWEYRATRSIFCPSSEDLEKHNQESPLPFVSAHLRCCRECRAN